MSRKKIMSPAWLLLLALCAAPVLSLSDQEIEQRFKKVEAENQKLRQEVVKAQTSNKKQVTNLKRLMSSQDKLQIHGFMSVAASETSDPVGDTPFGFRDTLTYRSDTVLALQFDYQLSEDTKLVSQLMANGRSSFDVDAEWIYLSRKMTDNWTVRAGRLRLPIYYFSDFIEVGFAYPWARPPIEVYASTQPNFEGVDMLYRFGFDEWTFVGQVYSGTTAIDGKAENYVPPSVGTVKLADDEFKGTDYFGGNIVASHDALNFRLGYFHFDVGGTLDFTNSNFPAVGIINFSQLCEYLTGAVLYNDDIWFALFEVGLLNKRSIGPLPDQLSSITTLGRRFGKWMPHLSFTNLYTYNDPEPTEPDPKSAIYQDRSYTLGLRYDMLANTSIKLEVCHYNYFAGSHGMFGVNEDFDDSLSIYTVSIDSVF